MPILAAEIDLYPENLLDGELSTRDAELGWWALYTRSRHEKELTRRLRAMEVPFYCPTIEKSSRTPKGRNLVSQIPLFPNYVFIYGNAEQRYAALTSNCVSRDLAVADGAALQADLRKLRLLIQSGLPVAPEPKLVTGARVRVRSGPLVGQQGVILQRHGETRLLVAVQFLQQGASVQLDEQDLEPLPE
jgi:transcriptional antiterminator RfaH